MWCTCFFLFWSRSESVALCIRRVHSRSSIASRFIGRFQCGFQLFHKRPLLQMHYIVFISADRWRHNFREIAVENFENSKNRRESLCAPLRIDSREILRKFHRISFGTRTYVHLHKFFSASRYMALIASVKLRTGSPKMARNEQVCAHQKSYRNIYGAVVHHRDCSYAPTLRFSLRCQMAP